MAKSFYFDGDSFVIEGERWSKGAYVISKHVGDKVSVRSADVKDANDYILSPTLYSDLEDKDNVIYASVDAVWQEGKGLMAEGVVYKSTYANMYSTAPIPATLIDADTYQKMNAPMSSEVNFFTHDAAGTLTYIGEDGMFLFIGSAALSSGTNGAQITFSMAVNETPRADISSTVDITNIDSIQSIGKNRIFSLSKGDTVSVYAKSSISVTQLTVYGFGISLLRI